jgi:hypothetical protein
VTLGLNGLFYLIVRGPLASMAWTWQFAVAALAGCRLVLHMHARAARGGSSDPYAHTSSADGAAGADDAAFALSTLRAGGSLELASYGVRGDARDAAEKARLSRG